MNRHSADELKPILQKHAVPDIRPELRSAQIKQLAYDARKMDILSRRSLLKHILLQASYLSRWIWPVQTVFLLLLFYYGFQRSQTLVFSCILLLPPCLTLILLYELSKSFSNGMWELEAPCRYSLWQLLAMRICFLSGTDAIIILAALVSFRMAGGSLWQFALCVPLPFFLTSAICLLIMQKNAHRVSQYLLFSASLTLTVVFVPLIHKCNEFMLTHLAGLYERIIALSTLGSLLLFLYSAMRLCRRQKQENTVRHWEYM